MVLGLGCVGISYNGESNGKGPGKSSGRWDHVGVYRDLVLGFKIGMGSSILHEAGMSSYDYHASFSGERNQILHRVSRGREDKTKIPVYKLHCGHIKRAI